MTEFGERVTRLAPMVEIAAIAGVSVQIMSRACCGWSMPKEEWVTKIVAHFKLSDKDAQELMRASRQREFSIFTFKVPYRSKRLALAKALQANLATITDTQVAEINNILTR